MITVQLNGGLGNQLFQYAAGKSLAMHHKIPLLLDVSSFQREDLPELEVPRDFELYNFEGITEETVNLSPKENEEVITFLKKKSLAKLLPNHLRRIYSEPYYHFDKKFFQSRKNILLRGQWQSEKYFKRYETFFRNSLQLKGHLIENCKAKAEAIRNTNSVAVHIRRADYLRKQIILEWHGVMEKDYYTNAFRILEKRIGPFEPFYFTDDPDWVKTNLLPIRPGEIVSATTQNHYEDFYLISNCRHNIIANSSFSWWGAWLNKNPDKIVIGPKKWFDQGPKDTYDILPEQWIKV